MINGIGLDEWARVERRHIVGKQVGISIERKRWKVKMCLFPEIFQMDRKGNNS